MMVLEVHIFVFIVLNFMKFCSCPGGETSGGSSSPIIEDLWKKAVDSYNEGKYKKTISYCTTLINRDRTNDWYFKVRGNCHARRGYLHKALADFLQAKTLNPDNPDHRVLFCESDPNSKLYSYFGDFGDELLEKGEYKDAINCYTKAIEKYSHGYEFYISRSHCYTKVENFPAAKEDLKIALMEVRSHDLRKDLIKAMFDLEGYKEAIEAIVWWQSPSMLIDLGNELLVLEKFDEALLAYTEAIIRSSQANYFRLRGECYLKKGDRESARKDFEKVAQKDETIPAPEKKGYGRALLSLTMLELGKTEEALKEIQLLDRDHILKMGDELLRKGNYNKSLIYYDEAIKRFPKDGECYRRRGNYYRMRDKFDEAVTDFETAIGLKPSSLDFRFDFIYLLLDAKKLEEAKRALEEISTKFGNILETGYDFKEEKKEIKHLHTKLEQLEEIKRSEKLKAAIGLEEE